MRTLLRRRRCRIMVRPLGWSRRRNPYVITLNDTDMQFDISIHIDDSVVAEIAQAIAAEVAKIMGHAKQAAPASNPNPTPSPAPAPAPAPASAPAPKAQETPAASPSQAAPTESVKDRASKMITETLTRLLGPGYMERMGDPSVKALMTQATGHMKDAAGLISAGKTTRPGELDEKQFDRWADEIKSLIVKDGKVVIDVTF